MLFTDKTKRLNKYGVEKDGFNGHRNHNPESPRKTSHCLTFADRRPIRDRGVRVMGGDDGRKLTVGDQ